MIPAESGNRERQIVHLRDRHFVAKDVWDVDLRAQDEAVTQAELDETYDEFLKELPQIQEQQRQVIAYLKPAAVHLEGLTDEDQKVFELFLGVVQRRKIREGDTWLRIVELPGRTVDGIGRAELGSVFSRQELLELAIHRVEFDAKAEAARMAAMVKPTIYRGLLTRIRSWWC